MKEIKLTQNKYALVDDEDFEVLNKNKWFTSRRLNTSYSFRHIRDKKKTFHCQKRIRQLLIL